MSNPSLKELKLKARDLKVKGYSRMSKDQICDALEIDRLPKNIKYETFCREAMRLPRPVRLIHLDSGWIDSFQSLGQAGKFFDINPGSIKQAYDRNVKLYIHGEPYRIEFHESDSQRPDPKDSSPRPRTSDVI